ncbi:MAG: transposase [Isosphaeraceae bacterium]
MLQPMLFSDNLPRPRWVTPPWTASSAPWLDIDRRLPADHLARRIDRLVDQLDITGMRRAYAGRGSAAYPPELLLRLALFEVHRGRLRPAQWFKDCHDDDGVRWILFGLTPSRSCLYQFRDRVGLHLDGWISQVLKTAKSEGLTTAQRVSVDGTFEPSRASRHTLISAKTLEARWPQLEAAVIADFALKATTDLAPPRVPAPPPTDDPVTFPPAAITSTPTSSCPAVELTVLAEKPAAELATGALGEPAAQPTPVAGSTPLPGWLGKTPATRFLQRQRYDQARQNLEQRKRHLQATRSRLSKSQRPVAGRIKVSPSDPEASLGFDKTKVFCPLYDVQLVCDLDSLLVLGYDVFAAVNDANLFIPILQRTEDLSGAMPVTVLNDSQYATVLNLKYCCDHGVTMYSQVPDNRPGDKKPTDEPAKQIPKREFTWIAAEQTYRCPEGHQLVLIRRETQHRQGTEELVEYQYRCPPQFCSNCPRQRQCTRTPQKGRIIKRSEHDDLWDELRKRMGQGESQALYKLRKQTVELQYADLKEHRGLRRFSSFGLRRARIQVGLLILAHDGLELWNAKNQRQRGTILPSETG